jgi:hypothetical protein
VPRSDTDHPQAEQAHGRALQQGSHGAVLKRHAHHEQADGVVSRIAEKVDGIGLKRGRARGQTGRDLDREHGRVDDQDRPEDAPVTFIPAMGVDRLVAAGCAHESDLRHLASEFKPGAAAPSHSVVTSG